MPPLKEQKFAYCLAGVLLAVGAIGYAAFPHPKPDPPIRLMFPSVSGNVLFTHKTHASPAGYGIACAECHHHPEDSDDPPLPCRTCHQLPAEGQKAPQACLECHDVSEVEDTEFIKSMDAFHLQCIGCHRDYGGGPQECASCHVL